MSGYNQHPGIDFNEIFAPTARWAALCTILAQRALSGAHIESIDISNAYLNGILDETTTIFMDQPEGYHRGVNWVNKLKKGLYRLKQSGRLWYERLGNCLEGLGFKRLHSNSSVYIWTDDSTKVIIPVFVNDLTIVSNSKEELDRIKKRLAEVFKLKDLGPITDLLGIEINYD